MDSRHRPDARYPRLNDLNRKMVTTLRQLRTVAFLEGASFLLLLFIAMPLKYMAGFPIAVRIVGSVHGLLFLLFLAALYRAAAERGWPYRRTSLAFVASIVPFGTFVFDRSLRREIESVEATAVVSSRFLRR